MKKIIITENQFNKLLNEISLKNDGNNFNIVNKYLRNGYLVHGSTNVFDKFETDKIQGGTRSEYGYGMYFSDEAYKALEYGTEIYLVKKDLFNFLDLDSMAFNPFEEVEKAKIEIEKAKEMQYNVRNNREYDYYQSIIDELETKYSFNPYEEKIIYYFTKYCQDNKLKNLEQIFKTVKCNLPSNYEKYISSALLKVGYDGVKCCNQYVIFNFDLLNNNLINYDIE